MTSLRELMTAENFTAAVRKLAEPICRRFDLPDVYQLGLVVPNAVAADEAMVRDWGLDPAFMLDAEVPGGSRTGRNRGYRTWTCRPPASPARGAAIGARAQRSRTADEQFLLPGHARGIRAHHRDGLHAVPGFSARRASAQAASGADQCGASERPHIMHDAGLARSDRSGLPRRGRAHVFRFSFGTGPCSGPAAGVSAHG